MKDLVILSDSHLGKEGWGTRGLDDLNRVAAMSPFKILILNGDMGATHGYLDQALEIIKTIPAEYKLLVCGNNDIDKIGGVCFDYAQKLQDKVAFAGIHVLDNSPIVIDGIAFVGTMGWYDGTLWRPVSITEGCDFPTTFSGTEKMAEKWYLEHDIPSGEDISSVEFFDFIHTTFKSQLMNVLADDTVERVVVLSHFVTSPEFLLYGKTPYFDYLGWFMGYDANLPKHSWMYDDPRIVMGIVGHTHRHKLVEVCDTPVYNVSGWEQPTFLDIPAVNQTEYPPMEIYEGK